MDGSIQGARNAMHGIMDGDWASFKARVNNGMFLIRC